MLWRQAIIPKKTWSDLGELIIDLTAISVKKAASLHVLAFSSLGDLLVAESEGSFDMNTWDQVDRMAQNHCRADPAQSDVIDMEP